MLIAYFKINTHGTIAQQNQRLMLNTCTPLLKQYMVTKAESKFKSEALKALKVKI